MSTSDTNRVIDYIAQEQMSRLTAEVERLTTEVAKLTAELPSLRLDNSRLETAWRAAGERGLTSDRIIARLLGLLRKLRHADPPGDDLIVAIDEVLYDPDL
jgi:hypothetical protein